MDRKMQKETDEERHKEIQIEAGRDRGAEAGMERQQQGGGMHKKAGLTCLLGRRFKTGDCSFSTLHPEVAPKREPAASVGQGSRMAAGFTRLNSICGLGWVLLQIHSDRGGTHVRCVPRIKVLFS